MLNNKISLESTLAVTIFFIGLVGLILVISTEHIYRNFALEHQQDAIENLLSLKTTDLVNELIELSERTRLQLTVGRGIQISL